MAYQRHDPLDDHPGYRGDSPEMEQKYAGETEEKAGYRPDDKIKGGYRSDVPNEEKKEMTEFERQIEEESKGKEKKEEDLTIRKVADEIRHEPEKIEVKRKHRSSIEEAIEDAIKEEKEVLRLER